MKKYEYKLLSYKSYNIYSDDSLMNSMEKRFNELSNEGWELFNITSTQYGQYTTGIVIYHFRRLIKTR